MLESTSIHRKLSESEQISPSADGRTLQSVESRDPAGQYPAVLDGTAETNGLRIDDSRAMSVRGRCTTRNIDSLFLHVPL